MALPKFCFNPRTHTGCDESSPQQHARHRLFQSTHPHGVRHTELVTWQAVLEVSIHAPTRGATSFATTSSTPCDSFNPRTHTGCDRVVKRHRGSSNSFNPRTHTGCDWDMIYIYSSKWLFQSTHPHGVRLLHLCPSVLLCSVSIHAPTRGATRDLTPLRLNNGVSIHAPTRGATNATL